MTTNYIIPINVLEYLGVTKKQYARMTQGEVIMLIQLAYSLQQEQMNK